MLVRVELESDILNNRSSSSLVNSINVIGRKYSLNMVIQIIRLTLVIVKLVEILH
jgi:hypothetical protein